MSFLPKVLIFDDEDKWATLIARGIRRKFAPTTITDPKYWGQHISSSNWDAVIVDVQILGSPKSGIEIAEQSILEFGVVSPMIVISNHDLSTARREYGSIFFDYISKTNFKEPLLSSLENAIENSTDSERIGVLLTRIAKKYKVFEKSISKDDLEQFGKLPLHMQDFQGNTIEDLIKYAPGGWNKEMFHKAGKIALRLIHEKIQK